MRPGAPFRGLMIAGVMSTVPVAARSAAASTAPSAAFLACMDHAGGVTSVMLDCGGAEIARIDARLNAAYHSLMTTLPAKRAADLRASQRTWLRHHSAETRRLAGAPDSGSLAFIDSQRFELQDLAERTILLERMLASHRQAAPDRRHVRAAAPL